MFTVSHLITLLAAAGPDLMWETYRSGFNSARWSNGVRRGGRVRIGVRLYLHAAQDGICPTCGTDVDPFLGSDVCHIVGSGDGRRGYFPGNLYLGHASCNVGQSRLVWEYGNTGHGETRAEVLARVAEAGPEVTASLTTAHALGYSLVLTPADFRVPEAIVTDWPVATLGEFIKFDPAFEGRR